MDIIDNLEVYTYRAVSPIYYHVGLSPKGARTNAGRFNREGVSALYLAMDELTAIREYVGTEDPTPLVLLPVRLKIKRVIDITGDLTAYPDDWQQWDCDWKQCLDKSESDCASWRCGDAAIEMKASGIRYRSSLNDGGHALAIFPEDAILGTCNYEVNDPFGVIARANPLRL